MPTLPLLLSGLVLAALSDGPSEGAETRPAEPVDPEASHATERPSRYAQGWQKMDEEARAKLHEEEIWFEETLWSDGSRSYSVLVGPKGKPIGWDEFYRRVGRPEYAESFERRELAKSIMGWANVFVGLGGLCATTVLCGGGMGTAFFLSGVNLLFLPIGAGMMIAGAVLLVATSAGSAALMGIPQFISDWPVTVHENFELAEEYNKRFHPDGSPDDLQADARPFAARARVVMAY